MNVLDFPSTDGGVVHSAFGVDHGVISKKKQKKASTGRLAAGTVFGAYHPLVAGKDAKSKAKGFGTSLGSTMVGGGLGAAAAGGAGGIAGALGGANVATRINQKQGWLKPEKKK